jgi:hypothetical protein
MNFVRQMLFNFRRIYNSCNAFEVEEKIMRAFGIWPNSDTVLWKTGIVVILDVLLLTGPSLKYLIDCVYNQNRRAFALCVPEALMHILVNCTMVCFMCNLRNCRNYLEATDEKRQDIVGNFNRKCNRLSLLSYTTWHVLGCLYLLIPTCRFIVRFYVLGSITVDDWDLFMVE